MNDEKPNTKSFRSLTFVFLGILCLFVLLSIGIYRQSPTSSFVRKVTSIIPYPAVIVDGDIITINDFLKERDSFESYIASMGETALTEEVLEEMIIDTLVNKSVMWKLTEPYNVEIDLEEVDSYYDDLVEDQGGREQFKEQLSENFGWEEAEFKERVVRSIVLALQMTDAVLVDQETQSERTSEANKAYNRLASGESFDIVAKEVNSMYQEGINGDLGYLRLSDISPEWQSVLKDLPVGVYSEVSDQYEHLIIFTILDRITAGEDTQLHVSAVVVPKKSLSDVITEYLETAKIRKFIGSEE